MSSAKEKTKAARQTGSQQHGPRSKSVTSKPSQVQTRTKPATQPAAMLTSSSALYKTSSETLLSQRLGKLSINDDRNSRVTRSQKAQRNQPRSSSTSGLCKSLEDIARCIVDRRAKNIVVMAGAGISTPSGIPDFRTPGTGLYDNLKQYNIPEPEAIFDIDYFENYPRPFYTLAKEIYPNGRYKPNFIHYFIRLLHEKGLLLRVYTQNIDGLERLAGIPGQKIVEAHGNFQSVSCVRCSQKHDCEQIQNAIFANKLPRCMKNGCTGLVKPDIVFFGEDLPKRFYYYMKDFPQADLLLVMGTSLQVEPFAGIVDSVRLYVPRALFNRNVVGPFRRKKRMNDVFVQGDILQQLKQFVDMLGWTKDMKSVLPDDSSQSEITGDSKSKPADSSTDHETVSSTSESTPAPSSSSSSSKATTTSSSAKTTSSTRLASLTKPGYRTIAPSSSSSSSTKTATVQNSSKGSSATDIDAPKLTKRQSLQRPMTRNNKLQEISLVNRMVQANSIRRGMATRGTESKQESQTIDPSLKPRLEKRPVAFHAQRHLQRTDNPRLMPNSDSSSSQSASSGDEDD